MTGGPGSRRLSVTRTRVVSEQTEDRCPIGEDWGVGRDENWRQDMDHRAQRWGSRVEGCSRPHDRVCACASPDTCECTFVKASVCVQIGIVLKVCVSGGFVLPVFAGGCTQQVPQARGLRDMSRGSTWVLGSSLGVPLWRGQQAGAGSGRGCPGCCCHLFPFLPPGLLCSGRAGVAPPRSGRWRG